jgi:PIN domain nuclease of toxin-antitoxin system
VHVSAASGWEIATRVSLSKLPAASVLLVDLPQLIASQGFETLPVTLAHGLHAGRYPMAHRDPLDLALQAFPCNLLW